MRNQVRGLEYCPVRVNTLAIVGDSAGSNPVSSYWPKSTRGPIIVGMRGPRRLTAFLLPCVVFFAAAASRGLGTTPATAGLEVALRDAYALAGQYPEAQVVRVSGDSMAPFFRDGAVLVLRPVAATALRPGVIAAYTNRFGETVVHRVVKATPDGWQVKGYHNRQADSTPVTLANLKGAVYAIFHPHSTAPAKKEVEVARLIAATPEVLAAPAR